MASTLQIGTWSWHERWLYPDQIQQQPDTTNITNVYTNNKQNNQQQNNQQQQQLPDIPTRYMDGRKQHKYTDTDIHIHIYVSKQLMLFQLRLPTINEFELVYSPW
jgi:hypothetical protein